MVGGYLEQLGHQQPLVLLAIVLGRSFGHFQSVAIFLPVVAQNRDDFL